MKKVLGTFNNFTQVKAVMIGLKNQGCTQDQIKVVSHTDLGEHLNDVKPKNFTELDYLSIWERVRHSFTYHNYDTLDSDESLTVDERELLKKYESKIKEGDFVILIEDTIDVDSIELPRV